MGANVILAPCEMALSISGGGSATGTIRVTEKFAWASRNRANSHGDVRYTSFTRGDAGRRAACTITPPITSHETEKSLMDLQRQLLCIDAATHVLVASLSHSHAPLTPIIMLPRLPLKREPYHCVVLSKSNTSRSSPMWPCHLL